MKKTVQTAFYVLLLFILSRLLLTFAACVYNYVTQGYVKTWDLLYQFDALWYVDIAEHGYQSVPNSVTGYANYAFYPFYPMVLRFVKTFLPDRFATNQIGILVSNLCTLIAGYTAVAAVRIKYPKDEGYLIAFLIFFAPHTIYFSMTYTEAMFLMFTAFFFYFCCQKRFLPPSQELPASFSFFRFYYICMKQTMAGILARPSWQALSRAFLPARSGCSNCSSVLSAYSATFIICTGL